MTSTPRHMLQTLRNGIPLEQRLRLRKYARRLSRPAWLGTLRRTRPLSDRWGYDRGTPVDRYYIERFLADHSTDIHGRVLEVKDRAYTERFGRGVAQADVLDVDPANREATVIADLAGDGLPENVYDCFILTQTLQFIYDTRAVIRNAHRVLRPGGVLLVTVPALSRLDRRLPDYWRFTAASCTQLFGEVFDPAQVAVHSYGSVLTAIAFLEGMAGEELSPAELDTHDPFFPLLIAVRAVKTPPL